MLKSLDGRPRQSAAENERSVVERIAENQRPRADQRGNVGAVGGEAHAEDDARLGAEEGGHQPLQALHLGAGAQLRPYRADAHSGGGQRLQDLLMNWTAVLRKAEVVVRAHVDLLVRRPGVSEEGEKVKFKKWTFSFLLNLT